MPSDWYLIPSTTDSTGATVPEYVDSISGITGYSGHHVPSHSPGWIVRVFGSSSSLSTLSGKQGVSSASDSNIQNMLKSATGKSKSKSEWEKEFTVG